MNQDLALSVLSDIMKWDLERSRKEFAWLQLMSRFKYDGYSDFVAGVRFIESLAGWLQQFEEKERPGAYEFVRTMLVYFGPAEIQHLIDLIYPDCIRERLLREVAYAVKKPSYMVWSDPSSQETYQRLLRKSLFFGLSDGARIDSFRRTTAGTVSNEQVLLATEISPTKWKQVLDDLRKAAKDDNARFRFAFLFDDFIGTGTTLQGKLKRFWEACRGVVNSHFEPDWTVIVHHYIATEGAKRSVAERERMLRKEQGENGWFREVEFSFELVLPESMKIDQAKVGAFWPLIQKYYNSGIETSHTRKGGGKDVRLGFGQCALPLVLEHNTPNNSIPIIWAEIDGSNGQMPMRPLFRTSAAPLRLGIEKMDNPFERRATEQVRNEEAFLALISPDPVSTYLRKYGATGQLYDRLVVILGTPGSGKTTMAKLFEYPMVTALLRNSALQSHRALLTALAECGCVKDGFPSILGSRLSLESDYREIWEFPYPEDFKDGLFKALLQARAVLGWFRYLERAGVGPRAVQVVTTGGSHAAIEAIGGTSGDRLIERAQQVENEVYRIVGALVPPPIDQLGKAATEAYRPFERH